MKHLLPLLLFSAVIGCLQMRADENEEIDPRDLTAEDFLFYARRPFLQEAWGRFSGHAINVGPEGRKRVAISMAVLFNQDVMRAQIVVDEKSVYDITQAYSPSGPPRVTVIEPQETPQIGLREFGLKPKDVTFSFLYWDLVRELGLRNYRGQDCRVMELQHPDSATRVITWFSAEYMFPLLVKYYHGNATEPARTIRFTDFKKNGDAYYVQNFRLEGEDWKTRVRFPTGGVRLSSETPPPADLFINEQPPPS